MLGMHRVQVKCWNCLPCWIRGCGSDCGSVCMMFWICGFGIAGFVWCVVLLSIYLSENRFNFFLVLGADVTEQIAVEKMGYVNGELCLMQV